MNDKGFRKLNIRVLEAYKKAYGDLRIPPTFVIPRNHKFLPYFQEYDIGHYSQVLRKQVREDETVFDPPDLNYIKSMGFVWKIGPPEAELLLFCFKMYKNRFKSCDVPLTYRISKDDVQWPECTAGINLGKVLSNIRDKGFHKSIHRELIDLGYDLSRKKITMTHFDCVYDALKTYKELNDHLDVEKGLVITDEEEFECYPEHCIGIQLGYEAKGIMRLGHYTEHREKLMALGMKIENETAVSKFESILSALQTYKTIHGNLLVDRKYVVAQGDAQFPASNWGIKLGAIVVGIRKGNLFAGHRETLEEIGFVYNTDTSAFRSSRRMMECD